MIENAGALSLEQWLNILENRHAQEIQLGLERVKRVAEQLAVLHTESLVITVAGTNGKGSTVAALEAIYLAGGYRVATYTSPHLLIFNERIRVNGQSIRDDELCSAFSWIETLRGDTPLTYFETTTLAALHYFKQCSPDVIILEVGMGGRLDATNIVDADLAIITTIDLDHQAYLGDTIDAIGYEKAGILRANQRFIYADENPPQSIIDKAFELNIDMHYLNRDYSFIATSEYLEITSLNRNCPRVILSSARDPSSQAPRDDARAVTVNQDIIKLPRPTINLKAATAAIIASGMMLDKMSLNSAQLGLAMQKVSIQGRQQIVYEDIITVFDVAHNPQAVELLAEFIGSSNPRGKVHAVFSGLKDKDLCGLIKPMIKHVDHWYLAELVSKRAADKTRLVTDFSTVTALQAPCFDNPELAYQAAVKNALPEDWIVVYGSFLTVSAIMTAKQM